MDMLNYSGRAVVSLKKRWNIFLPKKIMDIRPYR